MGDVVVGHRHDRQQGERPGPAVDSPGPLEQGRQVRVQVAWVAAPAGDLLARCPELSERLAVRQDVGQDDEHVQPEVEGQVLAQGERTAGGEQAFDRRIVGQVEEEGEPVERSGTDERLAEEVRLAAGDPHRGEDGHEPLLAQDPGTSRDPGGELVGRQARPGEDRQLLAPDEARQEVDRADPGLDQIGGVVACGGVDRASVHVAQADGRDRRSVVDRATATVHHPPEHPGRDAQPERLAGQLDAGRVEAEATRPLVYLDDGEIGPQLDDLAVATLPVRTDHADLLAEGHPGRAPDDEERPAQPLHAPQAAEREAHGSPLRPG